MGLMAFDPGDQVVEVFAGEGPFERAGSAGSARRRQAAVRQARRAWRGDEAPLTPADPVAPWIALSSSQHQRQQRPHRLFPADTGDSWPSYWSAETLTSFSKSKYTFPRPHQHQPDPSPGTAATRRHAQARAKAKPARHSRISRQHAGLRIPNRKSFRPLIDLLHPRKRNHDLLHVHTSWPESSLPPPPCALQRQLSWRSNLARTHG